MNKLNCYIYIYIYTYIYIYIYIYIKILKMYLSKDLYIKVFIGNY